MKRFISVILVLTMVFALAAPGFAAVPSNAKKLQAILKLRAMSAYSDLSVGSKGDAVTKLQNRLIALGYLASGEADGAYGAKTARAVHHFKSLNGISDNCSDASKCIATKGTQAELFADSAKHYVEPSVALEIPNGSYMKWNYLNGDQLQIALDVRNSSKTRTVKAFELYVYATNVWGERFWGDTFIYRWTTEKTIKPGATARSSYVNLPNRSSIDQLHVAVKRVVYTNGETYEVPNDMLNFFYWTIT